MIRRLLMVLSLAAAMSVATVACTNPAGSPMPVETVAPSDLPVAPSDSMLPSDSPMPSAS